MSGCEALVLCGRAACTKPLLAAAAVSLVETKIGTQMKIKELKEKLEANTSEKLFGIDEQPEQNCPKVDKGIKAWYSVQRDIEGYCKDLKRCDTVEEAEKIGSDIDWAIGSLDVVEEYEELRKQCEKIRAWGQGWKDLAKKLIEQQEDVSNLLADEFYVKLETESSSCG